MGRIALDSSTDTLVVLGVVAVVDPMSTSSLVSLLDSVDALILTDLVTVGALVDDGTVRLAADVSATEVISAVRARGDSAHEQLSAKLAGVWRALTIQLRVVEAMTLIPWLTEDMREEAVVFVRTYGAEVAISSGETVATAVTALLRDGRSCPPLQALLLHVMAVGGRLREAVAFSPEPLSTQCTCDPPHELTAVERASLGLRLAHWRAVGLLPAIDAAAKEVAGIEQNPSAEDGPRRVLLGQLFFAASAIGDVSGARRALDTLDAITDSVPLATYTSAVCALAATHALHTNNLAQARRLAASTGGAAPRYSFYLAGTVLAICAYADVDPDFEDRVVALDDVEDNRFGAAEGDIVYYMRLLRSLASVDPADALFDVQRRFRNRIGGNPVAYAAAILAVADAAWLIDDAESARQASALLAGVGADAEVALIEARLHLAEGGAPATRTLAVAVEAAKKTDAQFTDLRVRHLVAEHQWRWGDRKQANRMLLKVSSLSEQRRMTRRTHDLLVRVPSWASQLERRFVESGIALPRWIPGRDVDQAGGSRERPRAIMGMLTPGEHRVFVELSHGLTSVEIAERLYLSPHTVRSHIKSIYRKLGAHRRSELIRIAEDHDWI